MDQAAQVWILFANALAIYLLARTDKWNRWGYAAGFLVQPAFFYTTWVHNQWALFVLTVWFTYQYAVGVKRRFT